ncbi:MAG TPA: hypothetical protein VHM27_01485 [Rhizomicrobium sp.]|nr:hypothetical protein [Rhizomicrobium sp.]
MQGLLHAARHLAIIALLLRAMLPAGWMPDAQAGLVICSLGILGTVHHDGDQTPTKAVHEQCAFAAAAPLAAAPDAPLLTLPALHAFAAAVDRSTAVSIAARFTPQSPRAPPLNV